MDLRDAISRVFQSYDVRGIYPDELTLDVVFRVGRALAAYLEEAMRLKTRRVAIGRDMRVGSDEIAAAVAHGLEVGGITPVDIGLVSADMVYFALGAFPERFDAGVMITASHNPPEYNGLKFVLAGARSVSADTGLDIIRDIAIERADEPPPTIPTPERECCDLCPAYVEKLRSIVPGPFKPQKVVVDAANGMAGRIFPLVTEGLPIEVVPLNFSLDGTFPAHPADPSVPENLVQLQQAVLAHRADLGLIFDGDADRLAMVDEKGRILAGSILTGLFAREMLRRNAGEKVLFDLSIGWAADDCVRQAGGEPIVAPVGHSRIKERMRQVNGVFAGEQSCHYYFRDFYYCDSAMLSALVALEVISNTETPLSELAACLTNCYHRAPDHKATFATQEAARASVRSLDALYPDSEARRVTRFGIDVRKDYYNGDGSKGDESWWFCVRPSGTEPRKVRLSVEARSREVAERRMAELRGLLRG